jgi:hypothetical protein
MSTALKEALAAIFIGSCVLAWSYGALQLF